MLHIDTSDFYGGSVYIFFFVLLFVNRFVVVFLVFFCFHAFTTNVMRICSFFEYLRNISN